MGDSWALQQQVRERVQSETPAALPGGQRRVAMLYPSPYRVGMSSLGFQWILRLLRDRGIAAERCFLPDEPDAYRRSSTPPFTYETETPLGNFPLIGVSLAYELELAGLIEVLELAGIPPLRRDRRAGDPCIVLGGPITFSNPLPAAPFVDLILTGEAEDTAPDAVEAFFDASNREGWLARVAGLEGAYVPEHHGARLPAPAKASDALLPARSLIIAPDTELSSMFLLEGERGCHRTCSFCVMRRSTNGGMRLVPPDRVLSLIPDEAKRVGLVGAAISDHPKLVDMLETLVESGRGVSVSSLRADRVALKPRIAELLRQSGARTLTVASDAASQRLRRTIEKGTTERHLEACADIARANHFDVLKVYMMVGLPDEHDDDIDELIAFTANLAKRSRVALGIAPFVAKRNTPLDGTPFAGIKEVEARLKRLQKGLRGRAEVRPTSARWAWVEYQLAQGGPEAGLAVLDAVHAGGKFADWRRALEAVAPESMRPWQHAA